MDVEMLIKFTEDRIQKLKVELHCANEYLKYLQEVKKKNDS